MCFGDTKTRHQDIVGSQLLSILTGLLFKAQRASCLYYSNLEGLKKMWAQLLEWGILVWTRTSISKTTLYAILVNQTTLKSIFHDTAWMSLYIRLKFGQKIQMIVIFFSIHIVIAAYQLNHLFFVWNLSLVGDHVTVCVAYRLTHGRSWECRADNQETSCHSQPHRQPRGFESCDDHMTCMMHFCSFLTGVYQLDGLASQKLFHQDPEFLCSHSHCDKWRHANILWWVWVQPWKPLTSEGIYFMCMYINILHFTAQ